MTYRQAKKRFWRTSARKSLVIFVLAGAFMGTVLSPAYFIEPKTPPLDKFWVLILVGAAFGAFVLIMFEAFTRQAGEGVAYWNTYWSHILILQISKKEALDLCWESINALQRKYKLEPANPGSPDIAVQVKRGWEGYSERILIDLSKTHDSQTRLNIFCLPNIGDKYSNATASTQRSYSEIYKIYVDAIAQFIESRVDPDKVLQSSRGERVPDKFGE